MYTFEKNVSVKDEDEIWKKCTYPYVVDNEYSVSSYGNIRNDKTGKILKPYKLVRHVSTENVYYIIKLKFNDIIENKVRYKNFRVNRLIAWEFCPDNRDIKLCVMHKNDNKLDNYYKNLKWGSIGLNTREAILSGRLNIQGINNCNHVYEEDYIRYICKLMEDGKTNKEVLFIITGNEKATIRKNSKEWSLICHLRAKDRFTEIALQYDYKPVFNLSPVDNTIIKLMKRGKENIDIMHIYGYEKISDNKTFYRQILKCRKIMKICSTTIDS